MSTATYEVTPAVLDDVFARARQASAEAGYPHVVIGVGDNGPDPTDPVVVRCRPSLGPAGEDPYETFTWRLVSIVKAHLRPSRCKACTDIRRRAFGDPLLIAGLVPCESFGRFPLLDCGVLS